ncbi:unnamed protein product [Acanthoscelides obtectus]|nr:unnamed protein product [Acanthoscelides obtectus]CAK1664134.1 Putative inorganic phosphate cotransporter [Acanthoscelides obtectus]
MTICSSAGLLLPLLAGAFGSKGVMAVRAIQGLAQGFIFPSVHTLLAKWVPPEERSRLGTFVYAAAHFGTVVSMLLTGLIASSWYGWPMVFYSFSCAGLIWACIYALLGHNTPATHPHITMEERYFIESSLGYGEGKPIARTPWKKIFTSKPVWSILLTQSGQNWGFWLLLTEIPNYMSNIMNFNIKSNSVLSALPYLVLWLLSFVFSYVADLLINKSILNIGATRKLFNSIGLIVPAIALVLLGNSDYHDADKAVALLVIAVGANSAVLCGYHVNHIDISPNHSGTIMGITNGSSNIFGIIAPLFVQFIVTNEHDPNQWQVVFYITSGIYVLASVIFIIFASGEVQPWNDEISPNDKEKEKV